MAKEQGKLVEILFLDGSKSVFKTKEVPISGCTGFWARNDCNQKVFISMVSTKTTTVINEKIEMEIE